MTDLGLAQLSNNLVYAAMAVYACAFIAYAAAVAGLLRMPGVEPRAASVEAREPVGVGAGASTSSAAYGIAAPSRPTDFAGLSDANRGVGHPGASAGVPADGLDASPADRDAIGRALKAGRIGMSLTMAAFALHFGAVLTRGLSADRVPWGNMYEFAITGTLAAIAVFLVLARKLPASYLGVLLVPAVLLGLGLAVAVLYTESAELGSVLRSYWLVIHVAAMILSFGALSVGAVLSLLYLARNRFSVRLARLPSAQRLDTAAYRLHAFVFPLYTFAVLAGAVWAENAWGRYWGWDPKETWAFIVWVVYAAYLHARVTAGWRGGRAAAIALVGYACFLFNLFGINYLVSGLHSYAG